MTLLVQLALVALGVKMQLPSNISLAASGGILCVFGINLRDRNDSAKKIS